jgi:capsular polysaccharide transport system permease protein
MHDARQQRTPWQVQKAVVFALFIRELKTRFGDYKGGYVWMLVEPLAHIVIISLVFTYLRQRTLDSIDVPVFIVTGIVPFLLFKNITLRVMDSVEANRALFSYRQIRPMDAFIARTILDSILSLAVFVILLSGMAWLGMRVPFADPLMVLFVYGLLILMGLGLGMVFCVVTHLMPESKTFLRLLFMPLYFLSGVVFPIASLPASLLGYLLWNPLLHAIECLRGAFFASYHSAPGVNMSFVLMTTLILTFFGMALYQRKRFEMMAS